MKTLKNIISIFVVVFHMSYISSCVCTGPSDVKSATKIKSDDLPPTVEPGDRPQYKVLIKIEFNTSIDPTSLKVPEGISVKAKGSSGTTWNILGTVQYVANTKTAYFISTNPLTPSPNAGEDVTFTIKIIGVGIDCVKRVSGECIDGCDDDTLPGGNHTISFKVVG